MSLDWILAQTRAVRSSLMLRMAGKSPSDVFRYPSGKDGVIVDQRFPIWRGRIRPAIFWESKRQSPKH